MVDVDVLTGIGVIVVLAILVLVLLVSLAMAFSNSSKAKKAEERTRFLLEQENLARLRHRDLDAWAKEVNVIRAKKGLKGIPRDVLARVQFNLKYSIDDSSVLGRRGGGPHQGPLP